MLKLNNYISKEEITILKVAHMKWISIVYRLLPLLLIFVYSDNSQLVLIEKLEALYSIFAVVFAALSSGFYYEKDFYKGQKLSLIVNSFIFIGLAILTNGLSRLFFISLFVGMPIGFISDYGYMKNPEKSVKFDFFYMFYYAIALFIAIAINPFNDVTASYWIITSIIDFLWIIVLWLGLVKTEDKKHFIKEKIKIKEEIKYIKKALIRKNGDMFYDLIVTFGSFLIISNVKQNFALIIYLIIRKTPTFEISDSYIGQVKRILIDNIDVKIKKITNIVLTVIIIESFVVNTIMVIINTKTIFFNWYVLLFSLLIQYLVLYFEMQTKIKQTILEYNMQTKIVTKYRSISAVIITIYRAMLKNVLFAYIAQLISYIIINKIYSKKLNENNIQNI